MACFSPDFFSSFLPFRVSPSQIAAISSPMMSGVNSLDLNPLDYQVGGAVLESYHKLQPKPKQVLKL